MNFVVVGAGYVGGRVLARLPPDAFGLGRNPGVVDGRDVRMADLDGAETSPIDLPSACTLLYTVPPAASGEGDERLGRLLERVHPAPDRVVYLSTSGVYGDRGGALTDERTPPVPGNARSRRRIAAERLLVRWCDDRGVALYVLRVPGIYGPGRLGTERLAAGASMLRDEDAGPGNRIHVDDLVDCCIAAMTSRDAPPGVYNVGDGDHRSASWFSRTVARLAGLPVPEAIGMDEAEKRWSEMRLSFARESRRLDTTKMREVLGVTPRYADPEDGIRASLAAQAGEAGPLP